MATHPLVSRDFNTPTSKTSPQSSLTHQLPKLLIQSSLIHPVWNIVITLTTPPVKESKSGHKQPYSNKSDARRPSECLFSGIQYFIQFVLFWKNRHVQLVRETERIRCQLTTVEKANRDLKTDAMRNFAMVHATHEILEWNWTNREIKGMQVHHWGSGIEEYICGTLRG